MYICSDWQTITKILMDGQVDSESYWTRSASKGFSFDDDTDTDDAGGAVAPVGVVSGKWDVENILNDDTIFDNSELNLSIKSIVSEEALKVILQEQALDDRIISKGVTPEEELKLLRRQIQTTLYSPAPEATAYKLLLGKSVPLEVFKSLHEKEQLLDTVLQNGGGDAVIAVLLFLKKSLNRQHFLRLLQQRPKTLQHYISYLQQRQQSHEALELLQLCGKQQEATLLQFRSAMFCGDLKLRKQLLQKLSNGDAAANGNGVYQKIYHASLKLLELVEKERNSLDNLVDLNSTPIEVLHACCRKHQNWKEQELQRAISPYRLCVEQQIAPAQFEWTALHERACAQAYADLESVFERVPIWNPMKQKQFHVSFSLEAAIWRLYELQAPSTVLYLFLSKVSNASEKLDLAQRVKCTRGIIDAFASLKDVTQLTELRDTLPERSEEQFYCEKALKALQSKRWTTENIKLKL